MLPRGLIITPASITRLLAIHKADCGEYQAPYIPSTGPSLLMVVGKGRADGQVDLKPSGRRVEVKFGRVEGIIFMEFEEAMINASSIASF